MKSILIGKKGETIKSISINARKSIEKFTKKKVDLFLDIKINQHLIVLQYIKKFICYQF